MSEHTPGPGFIDGMGNDPLDAYKNDVWAFISNNDLLTMCESIPGLLPTKMTRSADA